MEWLFWQVGGLGPMAGQNHHFVGYAPETIPYGIERYVNETARLYAVMNERLTHADYLAGDYSIADMAAYPWVVPHERQKQNLDDYPYLRHWFERISERPAVKRAYEVAESVAPKRESGFTEEEKRVLFGQDASRVKHCD